ncbi:MAG: FtsW/RodA/SpoVE family cell cycle protein [Intestinimonas sp.]|jgi:rod shape determining protein RodA|nr:FtsW/RodA/SpoVE family cell cycle protein [Intestinimonas sp.]
MWLADMIKEFFRKADMVLLGLCLAASTFGLVLIYSATRWDGDNRSVIIQAIAICIGVLAYAILSFVDIELLTEKCWKWMFLFNVFILLLLLTPLGVGAETTGNNNWLALPLLPINIQPAEVAKIFFILLLCLQCIRQEAWGISSIRSVLLLGGHTAFMCGLIAVVSGDFGSTLVYLFLFAIISWSAGVKKRWFLLGTAAILGVTATVWPHIPNYIRNRITEVFTRNDPQGIGWQQQRSILAIGSGGLTGQGYLHGTQTQNSSTYSLIARHTDEIFAVCGEEFGLLGCILVIGLLTAIILRCLWVARQARNPMSAYIATGYAGMLILQMIFNIGMCLYVLPVVGLTLPFFSSGGSSIISVFACMGIVSGIKMRSLPSWLRD